MDRWTFVLFFTLAENISADAILNMTSGFGLVGVLGSGDLTVGI